MPAIISLIVPGHYPEEQRMLIDYLYVITVFIIIWILKSLTWVKLQNVSD